MKKVDLEICDELRNWKVMRKSNKNVYIYASIAFGIVIGVVVSNLYSLVHGITL